MSVPVQDRVRRFLDELDVPSLLPWARRRFGEGVPTLQLLKSAEDLESKQCVACVALLDLPERALRAIARGDEELANRLVARRLTLVEALAKHGVVVPLA